MVMKVLMPALSPTMEAGKLSAWLKKEGDRLSAGDAIAEIETDKTTMEVESVEDGVLAKILVAAGDGDVPVNQVIALMTAEGESLPEDLSSFSDSVADFASAEKPPVSAAPTARPPAAPVSDSEASRDDADDHPQDGPMEKLTMRQALRDAMAEEMSRDDSVFIMGEEVAEYQGAYKITEGLLARFGARRVVDVPITEHGFAGLGVGAAFLGLRPVVEFMTWNFAMQAMDQIINSATKTLYMSGGALGCPIVFRGPNGPAARVAAQHSQDYAAWYSQVPGLKVLVPSNPIDAKGLLKSAIRDPNPIIFLENEILYGQSAMVPVNEDFTTPIGRSRRVCIGKDVTIVSFGMGMTYALRAREALLSEGIEPELIDLRTLRPLDMAPVVASLKKTNRCVVIEEGWPQSGVCSEIGFRIMEEAFDYLDAPVVRVTGRDVPMPYAANLEKLALPSVAEVVQAVKSVCYR